MGNSVQSVFHVSRGLYTLGRFTNSAAAPSLNTYRLSCKVQPDLDQSLRRIAESLNGTGKGWQLGSSSRQQTKLNADLQMFRITIPTSAGTKAWNLCMLHVTDGYGQSLVLLTAQVRSAAQPQGAARHIGRTPPVAVDSSGRSQSAGMPSTNGRSASSFERAHTPAEKPSSFNSERAQKSAEKPAPFSSERTHKGAEKPSTSGSARSDFKQSFERARKRWENSSAGASSQSGRANNNTDETPNASRPNRARPNTAPSPSPAKPTGPQPHDVLGISKSASEDEIRKAYKRMSLKHHPDKNPDDIEAATAKFREVKDAYDVMMQKAEEAKARP